MLLLSKAEHVYPGFSRPLEVEVLCPVDIPGLPAPRGWVLMSLGKLFLFRNQSPPRGRGSLLRQVWGAPTTPAVILTTPRGGSDRRPAALAWWLRTEVFFFTRCIFLRGRARRSMFFRGGNIRKSSFPRLLSLCLYRRYSFHFPFCC